MSVHTYITKRGIKFTYDDDLIRVEIEDPVGFKHNPYTGSFEVDGNDLVEFMLHLTTNSISFKRIEEYQA